MQPSRPLLLFVALFLPGTAWFLHLCLSYGLSSLACAASHRLQLHGISLLALFAALIGAYCSWKSLQRSSSEGERSSAESQRFLSTAALLLAAMFSLAIFAAALENFFIEECLV